MSYISESIKYTFSQRQEFESCLVLRNNWLGKNLCMWFWIGGSARLLVKQSVFGLASASVVGCFLSLYFRLDWGGPLCRALCCWCCFTWVRISWIFLWATYRRREFWNFHLINSYSKLVYFPISKNFKQKFIWRLIIHTNSFASSLWSHLLKEELSVRH